MTTETTTKVFSPAEIMANREKWAVALESGEYYQCRRVWHMQVDEELKVHDDAFCCLGVGNLLVYGDPTPPMARTRAVAAYGLTEASFNQFVAANDTMGKTFPEIAAMVRALPPVTEDAT